MTCKDFEHRWNELLDAEAGAGDAPSVERVEAVLLAHAAECPACQGIAARYQTLRHAIRAWNRPPAAPGGLVERILSATADPAFPPARSAALRSRSFWHAHRVRISLVSGIAATVLLAITLAAALNRAKGPPRSDGRHQEQTAGTTRDPRSTNGPGKAPGAAHALDRALADATSATWELARSASEPAARISREVLDAAVRPGEGLDERSSHVPLAASTETGGGVAGLSVPVPSLDPLGPDAEATTVLLQVGDHLTAGVGPLSTTARHAFGFLLRPPSTHAGARPDGTTSTGARSG